MKKIELVKNATLLRYAFSYNLGDGRFVKISGNGLEEARVMDFIRLHTSIPVPRVHMVFEQKGRFYNVMDYITGNTLQMYYQDSSPDELENIATQLSKIIQQIRAIDIPSQNVLGSWEARPFENNWFQDLLWDGNVAPSSVFRSVEEFNSYWISRSKLKISLPEAHHIKIVPTHGDLNDRNIIIRDGQIVAIIDWETFGWYPEFWELVPTWNLRWRSSAKWEAALKKVFGTRSEFCVAYTTILDAALREPSDYDMEAALLQSGVR
jgi:aminoglycoside phosphotransferase (APT) family kinase protein